LLLVFKTSFISIFVFNIIQHKQICLRAKLTISKSSSMNEKVLFNEIQTTNFDDIITNPQNIHSRNIYVVYYYI
jgi:hypothetical protein